jgi:hypothetical protein
LSNTSLNTQWIRGGGGEAGLDEELLMRSFDEVKLLIKPRDSLSLIKP